MGGHRLRLFLQHSPDEGRQATHLRLVRRAAFRPGGVIYRVVHDVTVQHPGLELFQGALRRLRIKMPERQGLILQ